MGIGPRLVGTEFNRLTTCDDVSEDSSASGSLNIEIKGKMNGKSIISRKSFIFNSLLETNVLKCTNLPVKYRRFFSKKKWPLKIEIYKYVKISYKYHQISIIYESMSNDLQIY